MHVQIGLLLLVAALVLGVPVPFAFFGSVAYMVVALGYDPSFLLPYGYSTLSTIVLLAIPLFIMAGGIMEKSGIAGALVDFVDVFVGRIKGGLGVVAVFSCAIFGAITGSATATLSCIGSMMFPRMAQTGYPLGHSAALMANASVLGMLIPPSAIMILYAWVGNQSVLASFLASVIPGIILSVLLALCNLFLLRNNPHIQVADKASFGELQRLFVQRSFRASPALLMAVIILGGIYGGVMTPTEAAAASVIYAIPIGFFVYRGLTGRNFYRVILETATTTGVIMVMLYAVMILSRIYVMEQLPQTLLGYFQAITDNKAVMLLLINLFMVVVGMLMDDVSAVLLVTPILLPIVTHLGMSGVQFAAIVGVNLGMGNVTPPTAPLLYLAGRLNGARVNETLYPTLIMLLFAWLPTLLLTTYVPGLSLFLPRLILGTP